MKVRSHGGAGDTYGELHLFYRLGEDGVSAIVIFESVHQSVLQASKEMFPVHQSGHSNHQLGTQQQKQEHKVLQDNKLHYNLRRKVKSLLDMLFQVLTTSRVYGYRGISETCSFHIQRRTTASTLQKETAGFPIRPNSRCITRLLLTAQPLISILPTT
jgi:hypothetical protein